MADPHPLRILLVANGYPPGAMGGVETYTRHLALAFRRAGHDVSVFCREAAPGEDDGRWRDDAVDGIPVRRVANNFVRVLGFADYYVNRGIETLFGRTLAESEPDVVHFQHAIGLSANLPVLAAQAGRAAVWTLWDYWPICPVNTLLLPDGSLCAGSHHAVNCFTCVYGTPRPFPGRHIPEAEGEGGEAAGSESRHPFGLTEATMHALRRRLPRPVRLRLLSAYNAGAGAARAAASLAHGRSSEPPMKLPPAAVAYRADLMRRSLGACRAVLAPLPFVRETYADFGIPPALLRVAEPGMDVASWPRQPRPPRPPGQSLRLGYIGSLMRHKGVDVLLEALSQVRATDLELRLHGFFVPGDAYADSLKRAALRDSRVRLMGPYEQSQLASVLAGIDILLMPARWHETFSFLTREAILAGVPVLAADMGGMRQAIQDGRNGRLLPPDRPAAWAEAIADALADPAMVARMSEACSQQPVRGIDEDAADLVGIYRSIAAGQAP